MKTISIVVPCFNEQDNVREVYARTRAVFEKLPGYRYEMIFIDNNSTDRTVEILRQMAAEDRQVKVIINARNFGHIRSPYYALINATGDAAMIVAADLQEPPEMIPQFVEKWEQGFKAVVGVKESSEENSIFFFVRRCYYRLIHRLADIDIIENFTGFGLYDRAILDYCRKIDDPYPYFRGIITESGLPTARVPYRQPQRKRGFSKNNFYTLYDIAMLGITNHSKIPLRLATMSGFVMSLASLLVGMGYLVYKLFFWQNFPLGTAPVVIGLFFFASVQLFFIGILGEYIGSIHTQVLKRPLVVEKERINF